MTPLFDTTGAAVRVYDTGGRLVFGPGGGGPGPTPNPLPPALDDTTASMRPDGRIIFRATVMADGTGDYATVSEAVAAGRAAQTAQVTADRLPAPTPHHWVQIIIGPGHYTDTIKPPAYTSLIGAGGDTTVIEQDGQNALGVLDFQGRAHVEGIAFLKTTPITVWQPKYPTHNRSNGTTVWADCGFYTEAVALDREVGRASGNDGVEGGTVCFYRCRLNGLANSHGWDADVLPQTVIFADCTSTSAVGFSSGAPNGSTAADETWVFGGSAREVNVKGVNATLHLDPDAAYTTLSTGPGVTVDARTDWPIPVGALTHAERAQYGL